jgi:hypothetical protein
VDAIQAQKELVQLLLKRLKACAVDHRSFHGVFLSFSDEIRANAYQAFEPIAILILQNKRLKTSSEI